MRDNKWLNALTQISMILLASLIVAGALWQIGQTASAQAAFGSDGHQGEHQESHDHNHDDHHGEDGRSDRDHHVADLSLRGVAEFGETIIKMTVVISAIVLGQRIWATVRGRQAT